MPTYVYRCKSCSYEFEELQNISDPPVTECPSCGKHTVTRVFSGGGGLVFKGSGFYLTDYKKPKGEKKSEGNNKEPDTGTPPKPEKGEHRSSPTAPPGKSTGSQTDRS